MSDLDNIIQVNIDRQTQAVTRTGFGVLAIISEFLTSKTTTIFERHRYYSSLTEMTNDGWIVYDPEYKMAQKIFAQNPKPSRIMIGRIDPADASISAGLDEIQSEQADWYGVNVVAEQETKVIFDADLITGNLIDFTINGQAVTQVPFNTSHSQTMTDIKTQIEADITNASVTIDSRDGNTRTLLIKVEGKKASASVSVTGGASQAGNIITTSTTKVVFDSDFVASNSIVFTINGTIITAVPFNTNQATTMSDIKTQIETDLSTAIVTIDTTDANTRTLLIDVDKKFAGVEVVITGGASQPVETISSNVTDVYKDVAAWIETQKKIFFLSSSDGRIKGIGSDDIISFMQSQNYDRTLSEYHTSSQGDETPSWFESGWLGRILPYDPGSVNWAYKTVTGVASYNLTTSEKNNILDKNGNVYTKIGGVDVTEDGRMASGEWVDIIRGLDWLEANLQEDLFSTLVNTLKIPFTDEGGTLIEGIIQGTLFRAAAQGILVLDSIVINVPKVADINPADRVARIFSGITFEAILQGAVNKIKIQGTVTI